MRHDDQRQQCRHQRSQICRNGREWHLRKHVCGKRHLDQRCPHCHQSSRSHSGLHSTLAQYPDRTGKSAKPHYYRTKSPSSVFACAKRFGHALYSFRHQHQCSTCKHHARCHFQHAFGFQLGSREHRQRTCQCHQQNCYRCCTVNSFFHLIPGRGNDTHRLCCDQQCGSYTCQGDQLAHGFLERSYRIVNAMRNFGNSFIADFLRQLWTPFVKQRRRKCQRSQCTGNTFDHFGSAGNIQPVLCCHSQWDQRQCHHIHCGGNSDQVHASLHAVTVGIEYRDHSRYTDQDRRNAGDSAHAILDLISIHLPEPDKRRGKCAYANADGNDRAGKFCRVQPGEIRLCQQTQCSHHGKQFCHHGTQRRQRRSRILDPAQQIHADAHDPHSCGNALGNDRQIVGGVLFGPVLHCRGQRIQKVCHRIFQQICYCFIGGLEQFVYAHDRKRYKPHVDQGNKTVNVYTILQVKELPHRLQSSPARRGNVSHDAADGSAKVTKHGNCLFRQTQHRIPDPFQQRHLLCSKVSYRGPGVLKPVKCVADQRSYAVKSGKQDASQKSYCPANDAAGRNTSHFEFVHHAAQRIHHYTKCAKLFLGSIHVAAPHKGFYSLPQLSDRLQQMPYCVGQDHHHICKVLCIPETVVHIAKYITKPGCNAQQQILDGSQQIQQFGRHGIHGLESDLRRFQPNTQGAKKPSEHFVHLIGGVFAQLHLPGQFVKALHQVIQRASVRHKHFIKGFPYRVHYTVDPFKDVQDPGKEVLSARQLVHLPGKLFKVYRSILNFFHKAAIGIRQCFHLAPVPVLCIQLCIAKLCHPGIPVGLISDHIRQLLSGNSALLQSLLETSGILNLFLAQHPAPDKTCFQRLCKVVRSIAKAFCPQQLIQSGVKGASQPAVSCFCAACEHVPELFRQIAPESLCFLVVAKQDIKGLHPAGTHCVLCGVHRFAKAFRFLCRFKRFYGHLIVLICQCFNCLRCQHTGIRVHHLLHGFAKLGKLAKGGLHHLFVSPFCR